MAKKQSAKREKSSGAIEEQNFIIRSQIPSFVNIFNFPKHFGNKMTQKIEKLHRKYEYPIKGIKHYNKIKTYKKNNISTKKKLLLKKWKLNKIKKI